MSEAEAEHSTLLEMLGHGWSFDAIQLSDHIRYRFSRWSIEDHRWHDAVGQSIRWAAEAARATETPPAEGAK